MKEENYLDNLSTEEIKAEAYNLLMQIVLLRNELKLKNNEIVKLKRDIRQLIRE